MPADDTDRAQKFYEAAFGWEISKMPGDMPYWMIHTVEVDENHMPKQSGAINGGMMRRDADKDPSGVNPVIVVQSDDLDETIEKVKAAGGKLVLCAINPDVYSIFEILKMNKLLTIRKTEEDAIAALSSKQDNS